MAARVEGAGVGWQVVLAAVLSIGLGLAGTVSLVVRASESDEPTHVPADLFASATTVSTAPTSPGTPAPTKGAFVAQDAGFSAVFPTTPQRQQQQIDTAGVSLQAILYIATTSDEVVGAASATMPFTPTGSAQQAGLDGAVNGTAQNTKGTVVSRSMTTYLGVTAEDGVISTPSEGVIHERVLFRERKIFVILVITPKANSPPPDYDRLLATFRPL